MTKPASASATRVSGYAERPDYRVDLLRRANLVTVRSGARVLASSTRAIFVDEQDHALVVYLPREDVDMGALVPFIGSTTHCPFKGDATYWALAGARDEPIAWSYSTPYPEVALIEGHLAFYQEKVEVLIGAKPGRG